MKCMRNVMHQRGNILNQNTFEKFETITTILPRILLLCANGKPFAVISLMNFRAHTRLNLLGLFNIIR